MTDRLWRLACKEEDTAVTVLLIDPLLKRLFPWILAAGITPNMVTGSRLVVAIVSALSFLTGHPHVAAGLFAGWYVLDCVDGKLARLTGRCSRFGDWLDRITDRIGVAMMLWGLALLQFAGGDFRGAALAITVVCVWFIRVMNGERLSAMSEVLPVARSAVARHSADTAAANAAEGLQQSHRRGYRQRMRCLRITPWIFHDVEWLFVAICVGPLTGCVALCASISIAAMAAQSALSTYSFWGKRRSWIAGDPPDHCAS